MLKYKQEKYKKRNFICREAIVLKLSTCVYPNL